ncbi:SH3 domain-containing protein [Aliiroseovarius sp. S1339]|uniref:SH3 domain-containing protein n=1 Tax=Aliiroseovarius sp. S1339 TaxID=2936990 RepID=UPI0020C177D6|nr:SH3 domain-containing protein [Aliiroseovarius sp. S1339]MCK8463884.1 SH3 domain-containing protein [Aliiroseovarius sp. S1339]
MGIIKLSCLTIGVIGISMVQFGRDGDLPADRIGREPTIAQETILPVSAVLDAGIAASPETAQGEVIATANAAPAVVPPKQTRLVAVPVTLTSATVPQTPAEIAEAAARLMASKATKPTPAAVRNNISGALPTALVSGSAVNMRAGPSTGHGVVAKLSRGTEVFDMGPVGGGWSQIKVVDTGARGFMASKFLAPQS